MSIYISLHGRLDDERFTTKRRKRYRVLVVDDNPSIHEDFKKILSYPTNVPFKLLLQSLKSDIIGTQHAPNIELPFAFFIDSACDANEALRYVSKSLEEKDPYALIFMDVIMPPGRDGVLTTRDIWLKSLKSFLSLWSLIANF